MRPRGLPVRALALLFAALAVPASAAIVLRHDISAVPDPTNGTLLVQGTIANDGTQTADAVVLSLTPPPPASAPVEIPLEHLDASMSRPWSVPLPLPGPGSYVLPLRVAYTDAYATPLSSALVVPVSLGDPPPFPAEVALEPPKRPVPGTHIDGVPDILEPAPFARSAVYTLTVAPSGPSDSGLSARLSFVCPESVAVLSPELPLVLPLDRPTSVPVLVTNLCAYPGSRLTLDAVLTTFSPEEPGSDFVPSAVFSEAPLEIALPDRPAPDPYTLPESFRAGILVLGLLCLAVAVAVEFLARFRRHAPSSAAPPRPVSRILPDLLVLLCATALVAYECGADFALAGTSVALGGDLPAHHYLVSHLRESLAHGRLVSWAPGWWCGFPMFQYYFPLPYLAIVLLSPILSGPAAFNLCVVLGLLVTPLAFWLSARLLRLPAPYPSFFVLASLPLLLDTTHTMWGVNVASSLAGMISNSWSFALFLPALASGLRDLADATPRRRTVLLFILLLLSHFFTSVVLAVFFCADLSVRCAARAARGRWRRPDTARLVVSAILLAAVPVLVMSPWILPLVATRPWSVDFGGPWKIRFFRQLPYLLQATLPPAVACHVFGFVRNRRARSVGCGTVRRAKNTAAASVLLLIALSLFLFFFGGRLSPVFVNCRLWPFWICGALLFVALAAADLVSRLRATGLATMSALCLTLVFAADPPDNNRGYAAWDFRNPSYPVQAGAVSGLLDKAAGPGRLAFDMHEGNTVLGSSRAFEALPALRGKPILEGGIVNSALGSLAAYSIQGEISDAPAGWPTRVIPRKRNIPLGLRHLELLGVTHFIARSAAVQTEIEKEGSWRLAADAGKWRLYKSPDPSGNLVRVYDTLPFLETDDPQGAIVDFFGPDHPPVPEILVRNGIAGLPETNARDTSRTVHSASLPATFSSAGNRLTFTTRPELLGKPHFIAVSWFPNWRVDGAPEIHLATPGMMVVFPEQTEVTLRFAPTALDHLGRVLSVLGLFAFVSLPRIARRVLPKA